MWFKRAWEAFRSAPSSIHHVAIVLLVCAVLLWVDLPLCPTRVWFGLPCPGCGMTRAVRALCLLHFHEAVRFHPLVFIFAPLVATVALVPQRAAAMISPLLAWALLGSLLGVWVVRLAGGLGGLPDPVNLRDGLVVKMMLSLTTAS